jgi:hypothetical protein
VRRNSWNNAGQGDKEKGGKSKIYKINKTASIKELREELRKRSPNEMLELCLRLLRFKKENKEMLAYLLFESSDEQAYIKRVKSEIDEQFDQINVESAYYIKKSVRKILKNTRKYIRYSQRKETEVELLIYFCTKIREFPPPIRRITALKSLFDKLIGSIRKTMLSLHEDLQYDYGKELEGLLKEKKDLK